jgi:PAS domain S-box-containing protein
MRFLKRQSRSKVPSQTSVTTAFSLRQKFLLAFLSLVLGLMIALLLIVDRRQRLSIVYQMKKRGVAIATHLAAVSTKSLLTYNYVALEQDVEKVSQDRDILYAIVLEREGRVAAYSGHDEKQGTILPDAVSQRAAHTTTPLIQRVQGSKNVVEHYDIAVPVIVQGSPDKWGTVRVGLSLHEMQAEIRKTRLQVLVLGVLGAFLSSVAAVLLARRITAPIGVLTVGTVAVARGDLHHTIAVQTRDEIAVLAENFNRMTRELLKHHTALEQTNRQLDHKVRELALLANYNANILSSMTSGLFTLNLTGYFEIFNAMAETITGWQAAGVQGQPYHQVFATTPQLVQVIEASRYHHTPLTVPRLEYVHPAGHSVLLALRTAMLRDDTHVVGLLVIFEDLSPIQTLERQLRRADQLAALGQMAAGVAHEIKNPLASVRAFTQLVSRKHQERGFLERFDRIVLRELDRINQIVEELLELARPARLQCAPVAVPAILQRVAEVYAERIQQQDILLKTVFGANLPLILADAEQLYRAFVNLVLNAIEAMDTGGELTITCRPVPRPLVNLAASGLGQGLDEPQNVPAVAHDLYTSNIEVAISDTGAGIPAEQLDVLFMPFHTTKPKGTGLGLALTHKIIEEHHGSIHVASQMGHGTVMTVTLPVTSTGIFPSAQTS